MLHLYRSVFNICAILLTFLRKICAVFLSFVWEAQ